MTPEEKNDVKRIFSNAVIENRVTTKNAIILNGKFWNKKNNGKLVNFKFNLIEDKQLTFEYLLIVDNQIILNGSQSCWNGFSALLSTISIVKEYTDK